MLGMTSFFGCRACWQSLAPDLAKCLAPGSRPSRPSGPAGPQDTEPKPQSRTPEPKAKDPAQPHGPLQEPSTRPPLAGHWLESGSATGLSGTVGSTHQRNTAMPTLRNPRVVNHDGTVNRIRISTLKRHRYHQTTALPHMLVTGSTGAAATRIRSPARTSR